LSKPHSIAISSHAAPLPSPETRTAAFYIGVVHA
jgi:hypothetical protein